MRRLFIGLIRVYRATVSPLLPSSCRYLPTCSEYAETAVRRFGALRGGWLALKRVLRCHPLGGSGPDPVPPRGSREDGARADGVAEADEREGPGPGEATGR